MREALDGQGGAHRVSIRGFGVRLTVILNLVLAAWPVSEIILSLVRRAKRGSARVRDRGSLGLLWGVIIVSMLAAHAIQFARGGTVGASSTVLRSAALVLLVVGLVVRWTAIITLGRFFTSTVAIQREHRIVRAGLYGSVRHPSYSGLLLAFLGLAVSFGNWLSFALIAVPVTAALLYRVHVEEMALLEAFGEEYADYCMATKRLIPGVY